MSMKLNYIGLKDTAMIYNDRCDLLANNAAKS